MQKQENFLTETGESRIPLRKRSPSAPKRRWTNKEELLGWAFACVPIIGFLIFGLIPLILSFYIAFNHFPGLKLVSDYSDEFFPYVVSPAGFDNFLTVLKDPEFWQSILNTLFEDFYTSTRFKGDLSNPNFHRSDVIFQTEGEEKHFKMHSIIVGQNRIINGRDDTQRYLHQQLIADERRKSGDSPLLFRTKRSDPFSTRISMIS